MVRAWMVCAVLSWVVGCSEEPSAPSSGDGGAQQEGGAGGDDAGGNGGGGQGGEGGNDVDHDIGHVSLIAQPTRTTAEAAYYRAPGSCRVTATAGACQVHLCDGGEATFESAGAIHISGGTTDFTIEATEYGDYLGLFDDPLYTPGQLLLIDVAGSAAVPAHQLTARAPQPVELLAPSLAALVIDRTEPLSLEWSAPAAPAIVRAQLYAADTFVSCETPASDAQLTIAPEALIALPATNAGLFGVVIANEATTTLDGWSLSASVGTQATSASAPGGQAATLITLE
jgi:hypothetical protein